MKTLNIKRWLFPKPEPAPCRCRRFTVRIREGVMQCKDCQAEYWIGDGNLVLPERETRRWP